MNTIPIPIHLTVDDRAKLDQMAREEGLSRAAFVRVLIRTAYTETRKAPQPAQRAAGGLAKVFNQS